MPLHVTSLRASLNLHQVQQECYDLAWWLLAAARCHDYCISNHYRSAPSTPAHSYSAVLCVVLQLSPVPEQLSSSPDAAVSGAAGHGNGGRRGLLHSQSQQYVQPSPLTRQRSIRSAPSSPKHDSMNFVDSSLSLQKTSEPTVGPPRQVGAIDCKTDAMSWLVVLHGVAQCSLVSPTSTEQHHIHKITITLPGAILHTGIALPRIPTAFEQSHCFSHNSSRS